MLKKQKEASKSGKRIIDMTISSTTSPTNTATVQSQPTTTSTSKPGASLIGALGAGSGVNVSSLAQSLVDAERAPQKALIDKRIQSSEARISGYGVVMSSLLTLKNSFAALQDKSNFNTLTTQTDAAGYFDLTTDATAAPGSHSLSILKLASGQSSLSAGFSSGDVGLNGGAAISLVLQVGVPGKTTNLTVTGTNSTGPTPNDIVKAINKANAGVNAQIINTGDPTAPYKINLTSSATGLNSAFSVSTTATGESGSATLDFSTSVQTAGDAKLSVDGIDISRSSNSISDAIPGVTLNLLAPTSTDGTSANSIAGHFNLSRDTTSIKSSVQALVDAFNSTKSLLKNVSDSQSTVPGTGATLVNDSLVRQIGYNINEMVTSNSTSPGSGATALRDMGVTIQRDGTLALDSTVLDDALKNHFSGVVQMLSANHQNSTAILPGSRGIAGDAVTKLNSLTESTGLIMTASQTATSKIAEYNKQETALETRMQSLLDQYTMQFSAMDSIVGEMNSLKTSLTNQFTAWANQKN